MRIAHLPSSYFPESLGGTEIYVQQLTEALARRGHEAAVVYHSRCEATGSEVDGVVRLPPLGPCSRPELYARRARQDPPGFADFLERWRPDLLHFHALSLGAGPNHAQLAADRGIPWLVTYHTPTFSCLRGNLMRWGKEVCDGRVEARRCAACMLHGQGWPRPAASVLGRSPLPWQRLPDGPWLTRLALPSLVDLGRETWRRFMGGAAHIVACAAWCRGVLTANGVPAEKITLLRQGLPGASRTRMLRLPVATSNVQPARLGFFGRFCRLKGPDVLLAAAARLRRQGYSLDVDLVGPIPAEEQRWAAALLRQHQATYRGVLRGPELQSWIRSLDLVVVPSRSLETGPLTLLEAWDQGVPVVGAGRGGIREFMEEASMGELLFDANSADELARAMVRAFAWSGPAPRVVIAGMEEIAGRMEALYRQALCPDRGRSLLPCLDS
jgi:glycosyltransferase involved in cell wall biosynthesis